MSITTTKRKATVIGAGIGGLSASIALANQGLSVEIHERAASFQQVGAGLQLSSNALKAFNALGIDLQNAQPNRPTRLSVYRDDGKVLMQMAQNSTAHRSYYHIHRADLIAVLAQKAYENGVIINFDAPCKSADITKADLIIAADGVKSTHRTAPQIDYSGYSAWRALIPMPKETHRNETQLYLGRNRHLVLYPLQNGTLLNIVAVNKAKTPPPNGWQNEDNPTNFRAPFADFSPYIQRVLQQVQNTQRWALNIHKHPNMIGCDGVLLLGDAAQTNVPFLAQGAAMAIEDAYILGALSAHNEGATLAQHYHNLRAPRRAKVMAASLHNARVFHESRPLIRNALHLGMTMMARLSPSFLENRYRWVYDYDVTKAVSKI